MSDVRPHRIRMGLAFFVSSFAMLGGTPISGALITPANDKWSRPIIFSGVSPFASDSMMSDCIC